MASSANQSSVATITQLIEKNLFISEELTIDFFSWGISDEKRIAITFTPFGTDGEVSLNGVGYGGEFLLRNDFDIIAIKSAKNLWYQNLSTETINEVENFIARHSTRYRKRVGYGSSMGAYAAIQFSRSLKLDIVLALSPQFAIDQPYDLRWQAAAKKIEFRHQIDANAIAEECRYFIAYDPQTEDAHHVEKLRPLIREDKLTEIPTPYSGHPSSYYLAETGVIQELTLSVLKHGTVEDIAIGAHRMRSKTYLYELSRRLAAKNKNKSALVAINKALVLDADSPALHLHQSVVLDNLGRPEAALEAAYRARQKLNDQAHVMGALSERFAKHRDFASALALIENAISIDSTVLEFHLHRCAVCKALNDIPGAISSGESALMIAPTSAPLMRRLARLHIKQGGREHWNRSLELTFRSIF